VKTRLDAGTKILILASLVALLILATGVFGIWKMSKIREAFVRMERQDTPLMVTMTRFITLLEESTDHLDRALWLSERESRAARSASLEGLQASFDAAGDRLELALAQARSTVQGGGTRDDGQQGSEAAQTSPASRQLEEIAGRWTAFEQEVQTLLAALAEGESGQSRERVTGTLSIGKGLIATAEAFLQGLKASTARAVEATIDHERSVQTATLAFTLVAFLAGGIALLLIHRINRERREALSRLAFMATHDPLSGLFNRRHLLEQLEVAVAAAHRYGHPISLCICDLDDFKQVNDTHGHPAGDEVIRQFGRLILKEIRADDFGGRYGGDEFCIVLNHTPADAAREVVERLRTGLERLAFRDGRGGYFQISASFGVSGLDPEQPGKGVLIDAADQALYRAKEAGRNRVEVRTPPTESA